MRHSGGHRHRSREVTVIADSRPLLVGREPQLALVLDAVRRSAAPGLVTAVVTGEPGIGKTRLLAEVAHRLRASGHAVLTAEGDAAARHVPHAALAQALRSAVLPGAPERARRAALDALDPAAMPDEPGGARLGRACERVAELLIPLAPVTVLLDDLDHVDEESLTLLSLVLRRASAARLALVVAGRTHPAEPNPAAAALLDRAEQLGEVVRVELPPLSAHDVGRVVESVLAVPPDDGLVREVHRRADGNPFFATEIARSLRELDLLALDGGCARLTVPPNRVRLTRAGALLRRVAPLGRDAGTVARAVAVLRRVRLDQIGLLAGVAGLPEETVVAAFDDLLRARVVVRDEERGYGFSHALVGEALYQDVGPARRRRLHGLVAARLLDDRARGLPVDLPGLARHVAESAVPGDETAAEVLAEAALLARTSAPETAVALCERALELLPREHAARGGLHALLCRVLAGASRPADAVAPGYAALAGLPPGRERTRALVALLSSLFSLGRMTEALAVADREIAAGPVPAAVRAQRAMLLTLTGRHDEAVREIARTEAAARTSAAEGVVVFEQLSVLSSALVRPDDVVGYADRALRAAEGNPALELQALAVCSSAAALAGLVHDSRWRLAGAERLVDEVGDHVFRGELQTTRVVLDWLGGRWDSSIDLLAGAVADLEARQEVMLLEALRAVELEIRTWRGELDVAARLAALPAPTSPNVVSLHALAVAGHLMARGDTARARQVMVDGLGEPAMAAYSCILLGRLVELGVQTHQRSPADLDLLREVSARRVSPWSRTTLHRVTGLATGDVDAVREAVGIAEEGGLVFERARAQLVLGELEPTATEALGEACTTFQQVGAHALRRRASNRLRALGARVPRGGARRRGLLTDAEQRVARLVQQGMRNRDVAAALHYSPRTVEVYLSRIYGKLRVSSRLELARALDALDRASSA
ncbi:ATP-binding protein [Umezawaea beigongshangensis]|uniref:ATP-binding protein n=1 Tax=Umezawaea beigongshangensis TaxID=2780383 RepID=UPI0018F24A3B|nr:tetratricopeptide repeat protein [Umezawaea beigongshangensis]